MPLPDRGPQKSRVSFSRFIHEPFRTTPRTFFLLDCLFQQSSLNLTLERGRHGQRAREFTRAKRELKTLLFCHLESSSSLLHSYNPRNLLRSSSAAAGGDGRGGDAGAGPLSLGCQY
jgi:hypothetical protein